MSRHALGPICTRAVAATLLLIAGCAPSNPPASTASADGAAKPAATIPYGHNDAVGKTFVHDGVTLYYEEYGSGEPLLLVHGNGLSIGTLARQIAHFSKSFRVIAMDSRDQGKSGDSKDPLTYERMTDDLAALLDYLAIPKASVVGWSDGGIEALLFGIRHPAKANKLVAMAANLTPGPEAIYPETDKLFHDFADAMPDSVRKTAEGKRSLKATGMMFREPHITAAILGTIRAPTLIMGGDHDVVRTDHLVHMFEAIPNAQLAILPGSTHAVPFDDPATFNAIVERFLTTPFRKTDRIADLMTSFEKIVAETAH